MKKLIERYYHLLLMFVIQFLTVNVLTGQGWEKIEPTFDPPGTYHFFSGAFFTENNGWALDSENGKILKTTDGGLTWHLKRDLDGYSLGDIFFINDKLGWIIYSYPDSSVLLKTENSGETWEEYSLPFFSWKITFLDGNTGFAIGDTNYCYRTVNGGKEWQQIDISLPDTSVIATDIFFLNDKKGWILTRNEKGAQFGNYLLTSDDGGINWSVYNRLKNEGYSNIAFFDSTNGIITQMIGAAYYSNDAGKTWIRTQKESNSSWELIMTDSITAWISGFGTHLTTDKGKTWQKIETNTTEHLYDIYFLNNSIGYSFGSFNTLLKYKNLVGIREKSEINKKELIIESYPNPTNSASIISFTLPQSGFTELTIYNINGEKIKTIYEGYLSQGKHSYSLELNNLSSGVYFCNIKQTAQSKSIKILLLK